MPLTAGLTASNVRLKNRVVADAYEPGALALQRHVAKELNGYAKTTH